MKKIHINTLVCGAIGLLLFSASCEKDPSVYDNEACFLRFVYEEDRLKDSTLSYSFAYGSDAIQEDTVWLKVSIMGFTSDRDRPFVLKQTQTGAHDAVPGEHYVAFDDAALAAGFYYIPKGKTEQAVPVVIKRASSLRTDDYTLRIVIEANENFSLGSKEFLCKRLTIADRITQPNNWDKYCNTYYYQPIFGEWNETKHKFMISVTQQKWDDEYILNTWKNYLDNDPGYIDYMRNFLKTKLEEYNATSEDGPLKDGDNEVSFDY